MRILVTGVTGFVGVHFAESAADHPGVEVHGLSRRSQWPAGLSHLAATISLHSADLLDDDSVAGVLRAVRPSHILHLAGYAQTGQSFQDPDAAWQGNLIATQALYRAVEEWGGRPRIVYVSSGQVYGKADPPGTSADENAALKPVSPYAASKAAADLLSYQVTCHPGLDVVRARPFNHCGPRQSADFAVAHFARQIAAISSGTTDPTLETGDLTACRDLTDVRDVIDAYWLLLQGGRTGEVYNIGTGTSVSMESVVRMLGDLAKTQFEIRRASRRMRPADPGVTLCDAAKLKRELNWSPRFAIQETLASLLEYWRTADAELFART